VDRTFRQKHEKDTPSPGVMAPGEGIRFFATEVEPASQEASQEVDEHDGAS
jgi:hypothetical protein